MDTCYLCKSKETNTLRYGELMTSGRMCVHYFCLLFASKLVQRGKDNEGFLGFLHKDIKAEAGRIKKKICAYCEKGNASINCCNKKCRRSFHLICGIKNNALNIFKGTYQSFCHRHVPFSVKDPPKQTDTCSICYEELGKFNRVNILSSPCCKNGWFHKDCLLNASKSAGYFFKCPLCNNDNFFREELMKRGIFIPDQDAAWELEPNAYAELLERPNTCSAKECNNRYGRTSTSSELLICNTCGSRAMHMSCKIDPSRNYCCSECSMIELSSSKLVTIDLTQSDSPSDEDEEIDVVTVDDEENKCGDDKTTIRNNEKRKRSLILNDESETSSESDHTIKPVSKRLKRNRLHSTSSRNQSSDNKSDNYSMTKILRRLSESKSENKSQNNDPTSNDNECSSQSSNITLRSLKKRSHLYKLRNVNSPITIFSSDAESTSNSQRLNINRRKICVSISSNAFEKLSSNESSSNQSSGNESDNNYSKTKIPRRRRSSRRLLKLKSRKKSENSEPTSNKHKCDSKKSRMTLRSQFRNLNSPITIHSSDTESTHNTQRLILRRRTICVSISSNLFEDLSSNESNSEKNTTLSAFINSTKKDLNHFDSSANEKFKIYESSHNNNVTLVNKSDPHQPNVDEKQFECRKLKTTNCEILKDMRDKAVNGNVFGHNSSNCSEAFLKYFGLGKNNDDNKKKTSVKTKKFKKKQISRKLLKQESTNQSRIDMFFNRL